MLKRKTEKNVSVLENIPNNPGEKQRIYSFKNLRSIFQNWIYTLEYIVLTLKWKTRFLTESGAALQLLPN